MCSIGLVEWLTKMAHVFIRKNALLWSLTRSGPQDWSPRLTSIYVQSSASIRTTCPSQCAMFVYDTVWEATFTYLYLCGITGAGIILEPRNGSFWKTDHFGTQRKRKRDCSLTPVLRIILEHTTFDSASKASIAGENERFVRDFL